LSISKCKRSSGERRVFKTKHTGRRQGGVDMDKVVRRCRWVAAGTTYLTYPNCSVSTKSGKTSGQIPKDLTM